MLYCSMYVICHTYLWWCNHSTQLWWLQIFLLVFVFTRGRMKTYGRHIHKHPSRAHQKIHHPNNSVNQYSIFFKGQASTWQVIIMKGVANQSWLKTYWTKKRWEWNQWKHYYKNFNKVNIENSICFGYFDGIQPFYIHTWPSWHMNVTLNPTGGAGVKSAVNMSGKDSVKNANQWK